MTTYQPSLAGYADSHGILSSHHPSLGHLGWSKRVQQYPQQRGQQPCDVSSRDTHLSISSAEQTGSSTALQSTGPSTPASDGSLSVPNDGQVSRRGSESLIYHSLQIPKCITANGGNLAEFAAQMTCLFWFESADQLKLAETMGSVPSPPAPVIRLPGLAKPDEQFRKWVLSVLSTTQVTQNVILLALLFIYRLKMSTPQIKGRAGSEYRLLIVALMLGNKFLDDNTYTNKTWAEVSCFKVKEIHVMEVEFLSNMRYNLLASKSDWEEWLTKLACFHEYYDRALHSPTSVSPTHIPVSTLDSPTRPLAPMMHELTPITPTITNNFSPSTNRTVNWSAYDNNNALSPIVMKPIMTLPSSRKRSFEDSAPGGSDHPVKRSVPPSRLSQSAASHTPTRLPVPHLTLVTNQPQTLPPPQLVSQTTTPYRTHSHYEAPAPAPAPAPMPISLPPLQPGVRSMTTVYQPPSTMVPQQQTLPPAPAPVLPSTSYPAPTLPSHTSIGYSVANKRRSPGSLAQYATSSPMTQDSYVPGSGMHTPICHTPISNSPSFYLQHRNSPYKPIRHVNTLLYPPPSASLEQYHLDGPLHYQTLGRPNDLRTGVVPEYIVYSRCQHQNMHQRLHSHVEPQGQFPV